jgi:hypothetical protein
MRHVFKGEKGKVTFRAELDVDLDKRPHKRDCSLCGIRVHRSWRTGLLHSKCFYCRYLSMIYGPSIEVRRM